MRKNYSIPTMVTTFLALPECWIREGGRDIYLKNAVRSKQLPLIAPEYKELLDRLGLAYKEIKIGEENYLEYWDAACTERREAILPLYEKKDGKYIYQKRYYTGQVNSENMLERATAAEKVVESKMQEFKDEKKIQKWTHDIYELVRGKQAVGKNMPLSLAYAEEISKKGIVKILPVKNNAGRNTNAYALFNLTEIASRKGDNIELEVPAGEERKYVGANGWQVKEWAKTPWAKRYRIRWIEVVGK